MFTLKYNRTTTHISGLEIRSEAADTDPNESGVVSYYAVSACPVISRGRNLATSESFEDVKEALTEARKFSRKVCKHCEKAAEAMITAAESAKIAENIDNTEEADMAKVETPAKNDVNTDQGKAVVEQIDANIERAASLVEAANEEGLKELADETETLISSLSGKGSIAVKKAKRDGWKSAAAGIEKAVAKREVKEGELTKEIPDPYAIDGMRELVNLGVEKFAEGARLHMKIKDTAVEVAKVILDQRVRIPNKEGLPDLKAQSNAAKTVSRDTYQGAKEDLMKSGVSEEEADKAIGKLIKSVQNNMKTVVFDYLASLDSNPEEAARWELVAKPEEKSLSETVASLYGWELPKELTGGSEADSDSEEAASGEGEGDAHATDPADTVIGYFTKAAGELSKAQRKLKALAEDADKSRVAAEIDKLVTELVSLKAAL